jgi:type IV pilus biogenesis protein CpaD/CtpE
MKARNAALVLLGIALLVFAFSAQEEETTSKAQPEGAMKLHPANFTLASLKGGEEALKEVRALHRGSAALELEDALVAEYITQDGRLVKVWVGIARNESTAREMLAQMRAKLGASGMFTPEGSLSVGNVRVFKARGMGEWHYYYARKNRVVWISGMLSDEELSTLVESF